jgi:hypothetical protein
LGGFPGIEITSQGDIVGADGSFFFQSESDFAIRFSSKILFLDGHLALLALRQLLVVGYYS